MEILRAFQLAIYNLLIAAAIFYSFKIGAAYSREMSFVMYGIYFVLIFPFQMEIILHVTEKFMCKYVLQQNKTVK